jgi:threonyl-tRNA synthetase
MLHIRLPDGASRALDPASTAADLARAISPSLARRTVAAVVDGRLSNLSVPLPDGAAVELVSRDDPRALELIRHDLAHVLAEALREAGPRVETDLRNEKIGHKVREHALKKVPFLIAPRAREAEDQTVTIRRHGSPGTRTLPLAEAVAALVQEARPPRGGA